MSSISRRLRMPRQLTHPPKFVMALGIALIAAFLMTCLSVYMYVRSGVSNIDLSRPGYEAVRKDIQSVDNSQDFSSSGPLDAQTVDQFNSLYVSQSKNLHSFDDFTKDVTSNDSLGMPLN